jgi:hypothetical protein
MIAGPMTSARLLAAATGGEHADHTALIGPLPLRGAVRPGRIGPLGALVAASGLRGRGGGWFPFARKIEAVAAATGSRSPVVVVNGMESEPLSQKDAHLLAVAPHLVMDGATLAAEAIGARQILLAVPGDPEPPRVRVAGWLRSLAGQRAARGVDPVEITVVTRGRRCPRRHGRSRKA